MPADNSDPDRIRFWFRGEIRELTDVHPALSVLHWLRDDEGCTGTKEGCNQGDCGSCTVVIAGLRDGELVLHTANSCLLPVPLLHARALFTVEDVAGTAALHPVQQALVEHGGSQCGFCTPGFVMSLWCAAENSRIGGTPTSRDDLAEAISGNLCRCTGYRPILDAAVAASTVTHESSNVIQPSTLRTTLEGLDSGGTLRVTQGSAAFISPDTEQSLGAALHEHRGARMISGGTDLVLAMRANGDALRDDLVLISTDRVTTMQRIEAIGTSLSIGAAVPLDDAWRALVERAPSLARMHQRFASPAIRAIGTIGGNVANGSPIADLTPVLLALDAAVVLGRSEGSRTLPLAEFATGVRTTVLQPGEFLSRIVVPVRAFDRDIRAYKVSRRFDDDISSVSAAFALELAQGIIVDLRAVFGGMATTVHRATATELALRGRPWDAGTLAAAQSALSEDFRPITDHRASAQYRERAAIGLLHRWWLETGVDAPAVPVDVWTQP